ncbi:YraN family protein [Robertkochia sediminum]|uniref:YraN family protein n=1 Tax=Robertkochia sediminum TaxID=2785326 RepID=UPI001931640C|nr:YraN family protein [Robertkochia sediminum]MBL7473961.1 YraN family protein [Robertkochia sediminum]
MSVHHEFGKWAETQAVLYLEAQGYEVLERNYRYDRAEVDIIAKYADRIIIAEVKARSTDYFGDPHDFISRKKVRLLVKAANHYIRSNGLDQEVRFDAIAIVKQGSGFRVVHLEDAFYFF